MAEEKTLSGGGTVAVATPVDNSSFDYDPSVTVATVDAYAPRALDAIADGQSIAEVTDAGSATCAPEKSLEYSKNSNCVLAAEELNMTMEEYEAYTLSLLPPGVDTEEITREVRLDVIEKETSKTMKAFRKKGLGDKAPSLLIRALKFTQNVGKIADILGLKSKLDNDYLLGLNVFDPITEGSVVIAGVETLLKRTEQKSVLKDLPNMKLFGKFKKHFVKEIVTLCAKYGSYTSVRDLIRTYPDDIGRTLRLDSVYLILQGFRLRDEDLWPTWESRAKIVVDHLDEISPGWRVMRWRETDVINMDPWVRADGGACSLLRYDERTRYAATLQFTAKYENESPFDSETEKLVKGEVDKMFDKLDVEGKINKGKEYEETFRLNKGKASDFIAAKRNGKK